MHTGIVADEDPILQLPESLREQELASTLVVAMAKGHVGQ